MTDDGKCNAADTAHTQRIQQQMDAIMQQVREQSKSTVSSSFLLPLATEDVTF